MRQPKPHPLEEAARLWRAGAYWEAHEALEALWREARGEERCFLQGLIQLAAALEARRRGHAEGARRNLAKARRKARRCGRLAPQVEEVARALERGTSPRWLADGA